ncbi:adenine nucleotide translocase lysine N-methyltransferase isoform X1 [Hippopotamus amphibius kiboko]|uniref:adenine nucleotide translocase lysine N-methyltransferase isoform X1 n=1 Tax=Hippopotamus amphibius kiboko TaxID=575201 RepID=UPI002591F5B3|nr:adenine nucleotide translocase lysine N-methyltransferase isoform X1 [Hippopotamus amphibius kiboko]
MEQDDPAEALTELRDRRLGALGLLQVATGSGLAAYTVWALLLQPGFRRVPLRLQVLGQGAWRTSCQPGGTRAWIVALSPGVRVPYVGASARQVEHVLSLLRGRPGKMVDLGSGDGRIVLAAHKCGLRPAVGYELNPWLVGLAWLHAWRAGCAGSVCYRRENLWKVNLRDCHNVSVFLAPSVLPLLEDKLQAELPAGARVVSGRFPLPTWQPVAVVGEGLDRVWAYDVHSGGPAGQAVPGPTSASVPGAPSCQLTVWTQ